MCGLFGHSKNGNQDLENSLRSLETLYHRGPDQSGKWENDLVFIGHRRLSILDLTDNGRQPMVDRENTVVISVNGEIYSFKDIRKELVNKYNFISKSDSEVILHGYKEWGIDKLLDKIDGMFAIVIFDINKNKIYLVRDRMGIKPLYYSLMDDKISWASELKALADFFSSKHLNTDYTALYDFLTYSYIPTPKTLYKNIQKLEPAHYIEYDLGEKKALKKKYWNIRIKEDSITIKQASEHLKHIINKSVKSHMISDVPVGFFLSGGIDSSLVTMVARDLSDRVSAFSIGFDIEEHSELKFAKNFANNLGINHKSKILTSRIAQHLYHKMAEWYDEPFADTSALPTHMVSKFAKENVTVVLTGDGGDEIFGGYNWYMRFSRLMKYDLSRFKKLKWLLQENGKTQFNASSKIRRKIDLLLMNDLEKYSTIMGGMRNDHKLKYKTMWNIEDDYDDIWYFRKYYLPDLPLFTRLQYLDLHTYLHDDILTKVDRTSMAVSLEARVPLLSREIVEFSFSIPQKIRLYGDQLKGIIKHAYKDQLPSDLLRRRKKGFSIPRRAWSKTSNDLEIYPQEKVLSLFNY